MKEKTLKQLCANVKCESKYGAAPDNPDFRDAHRYKVTLRYQRRSLTVPFYMGSACTDEPDARGVLDCLLSDAQAGEQSFHEFCNDFGYEEDSRRAERIYKACVATVPRLRRLLGDDFETFFCADRN